MKPRIPPVIVLVEPQLGENIGAVARAMGNFGFSELRLVSPRDGWPNPKALAVAAHAASVIEGAKLFVSVEEALEDIQVVYAATARDRYLAKQVVTPREMVAELGVKAEAIRAALMFGPERSGLTNEAISLADRLVTIPVNPDCPSINLAQSVAVLCYEWSTAAETVEREEPYEAATAGEVAGLFAHLEGVLEEKRFFKVPQKQPGMIKNIRSIFKRIDRLSGQDVRTLRGIIRCLSE